MTSRRRCATWRGAILMTSRDVISITTSRLLVASWHGAIFLDVAAALRDITRRHLPYDVAAARCDITRRHLPHCGRNVNSILTSRLQVAT